MKNRLLGIFLAFVIAVSLNSTAFAHSSASPNTPVTMDGDISAMAVIDEDNNLWVYKFSYLISSLATSFKHIGYEKPVILDSDVASVSVSYTHIAYIKTDGSLWIQGNNQYGGAGTGERQTVLDTPTKIMDNVIAVSASDNATAAIRSDNSLWLWGNTPGLHSFGYDFEGEHTPHKVAEDVVAVSLIPDTNADSRGTTAYGFFLKEDGTLWGWGSNFSHVLSTEFYGMLNGTDLPVKLMDNVVSFCTGDAQCAVVTKNGDLYVWGNNYFGTLGFDWNPDTMQGKYQLTPKKVMSNVSKVAIGNGNGSTIYAIKTDGSLWGAGNSEAGQLGEAYASDVFIPKYVKIMDGVTDIATVKMGVYVTKSDGSLWAWGNNTYSRLAINSIENNVLTPTQTTFPVKVASPKNIKIGTLQEPSGNPFNDVAYGSYCYDAIMWALENNITNGTAPGKFAPQSICTRGQAVTFLWRTMGCPEPQTQTNPFVDVKETDYFYKPILWAYENGITNGTDVNKFSPNNKCGEAEIITFVWRTLGQPEADVSALPKSKRNTYFAQAQAWAWQTGLISSFNTINVVYLCTRANIVTYLYEALA